MAAVSAEDLLFGRDAVPASSALAAAFKTLANRLHGRCFEPGFDHATKAALTIVSNELYRLADEMTVDEPALATS